MSVLPDDLMAGAFVCRHKAGRWNSVLSDQFGKCSHPLKPDNDDLYNIFNDQVALTKVNACSRLLIVWRTNGRFLIVGQQRDMELMPIFGYELCAVPPSLVEYGCLRKGNKAPQLPDVVIVDAQQLMYHVIWPCGGTVSH